VANTLATAHIATLLQNYVDHSYAGTQNSSGDEQLHLDIDCDNAVFRAIRDTGVFVIAASEETPVETDVRPSSSTTTEDDGPVYSIGFDPLDGSSIIDANFSVGSIFGIWPGKGLLGRTGREQVASAVSLYGPRTTLVIALPSMSRGALQGGDIAFEVTLVNAQSHWEVSRSQILLKPTMKVFGECGSVSTT
jgi:sedoheptulose-bisphosphatase